jgi:hypothetical protein
MFCSAFIDLRYKSNMPMEREVGNCGYEYPGSGCVSFQEGFLKTSNVLGKRLRELG